MVGFDPCPDRSVYQTDVTCKESPHFGPVRLDVEDRSRWLRGSVSVGLIAAYILLSLSFLWAGEPPGSCREESVPREATQALVRHLNEFCTDQEREARVIRAEEIIEALKNGWSISLSRVVITGDLYLDDLPLQVLDKVLPQVSEDNRRTIEALDHEAVRLMPGTLSIRDSEVRGRFLNRTRNDILVISGPVVFTGSRFQESVDLSRTVFLGMVDCSSTSFAKESYFVQARFRQPALFVRTQFGHHTRFHRSVFTGTANFYHARFNGLAELLEVSFEQEAAFSGAQFTSGTGFSGSRFYGIGDFLDARFEGDVYFLFARFDREARFRGAAFRAVADFSDAVFTGKQDLVEAHFAKPPSLPQLVAGEISAPAQPGAWVAQYGITIAFLVLSLLLLGYIFRIR
jgi:hypothetical protein